jgi:hypothetical protein
MNRTTIDGKQKDQIKKNVVDEKKKGWRIQYKKKDANWKKKLRR